VYGINGVTGITNPEPSRAGGILTHEGPATTESSKLIAAIQGNLTIATNGLIDLKSRGYKMTPQRRPTRLRSRRFE